MVFKGLAKLARDSNLDRIDFSMLGEEDKQRILSGGSYPSQEIKDCEITFFNRTFSKRELFIRADNLILEGKFREAATRYIIAGRKDLADFLAQYREELDTRDLVSSGSISMRKPDPRYKTFL